MLNVLVDNTLEGESMVLEGEPAELYQKGLSQENIQCPPKLFLVVLLLFSPAGDYYLAAGMLYNASLQYSSEEWEEDCLYAITLKVRKEKNGTS